MAGESGSRETAGVGEVEDEPVHAVRSAITTKSTAPPPDRLLMSPILFRTPVARKRGQPFSDDTSHSEERARRHSQVPPRSRRASPPA